MDRRNFLAASITGAVAISLPSLHCDTGDMVERPAFLESSAGTEQVMQIGKLYTETYPLEANKLKLKELIHSTLPKGNSISSMRSVIEKEFLTGQVVILNGWILSLTEARQAALSFLNL
jgi:hypothetical protein